MFSYSARSQYNKNSCHPDLQAILDVLITIFDHSIIFGYRNAIDQAEAVASGNSDLNYPLSKHNKKPSLAVDIVPYPGLYKAGREKFIYMSGLVFGIAGLLKLQGVITHNIRWGGDWDGDKDFKDQSLNDLAHFELIA